MEEHLATLEVADLEQLFNDPELSRRFSYEILPDYLCRRRWFGSKGGEITGVTLTAARDFPHTRIRIAELTVEVGAETENYILPLTIVWDDVEPGALSRQLALARVQHMGRNGILTDGFSTQELALAIYGCLLEKPGASGQPEGFEVVTTEDADLTLEYQSGPIRWLSAEQSNSSLIIGELLMVKLIRHIFPGVHPEVEMTRYLTQTGVHHTAPLVGEVALVNRDGARSTFLIVQKAIANQGDAWTWMLARLRLIINDTEVNDTHSERVRERLKPLVRFCGKVGMRLAEIHCALSQPSDDMDFSPQLISSEAAQSISRAIQEQVEDSFKIIREMETTSKIVEQQIMSLLSRKVQILNNIEQLAQAATGTFMTRTHGDFHLGQVLVADEDAIIIDFEGEPSRDLEHRRAKTHHLRDVAGLLRSLDYLAASTEDDREFDGTQYKAAGIGGTFATMAKQAFLDAYFLTSAHASAVSAPRVDSDRILKLFLLEKAAYEIAYEAGNRPNWLPIPVAGLAALAADIN